ncbi:MAG: hypothetical protein HeimC3_25930 [Candidatus Heimdallarchaeota archaeon LC_3]|nr:MAG: hypothetical protein HeimC3_25930 [Candidatus Heimdallarchaeota archaeon LC_3]
MKTFSGSVANVDFSYLWIEGTLADKIYGENAGIVGGIGHGGYRNPEKDAIDEGAYGYSHYYWSPDDLYNRVLFIHEMGHLFSGEHSKATVSYKGFFQENYDTIMREALGLLFDVKYSDESMQYGCYYSSPCDNLYQIRKHSLKHTKYSYSHLQFQSFEGSRNDVETARWVFADNSHWETTTSGSPKDGSKVLKCCTTSGTVYYETVRYEDEEFRDGTIEGWIKASGNSGKRPGLWLRAQGTQYSSSCSGVNATTCEGYIIFMKPANNRFWLKRIDPSGTTTLGSYYPGGSLLDTWWFVRFESSGHSLKVWISTSSDIDPSSTPMIDVIDSTYGSGYAALSGRSSVLSGAEYFDGITVKIPHETLPILNPGFEDGTTNTQTNWWSETRLSSGSYGPSGDDDKSPWFYDDVTQSGDWSATIMGPWTSNSRTKVVSPQLALPLGDNPVLDFWQGIGGSSSQWGYYSWTGTRIIFSMTASTSNRKYGEQITIGINNCEINAEYSLLVGSNLNVLDQKTYNFTAGDSCEKNGRIISIFIS